VKDVGVWVVLGLAGLAVVSAILLGGVDTGPKLAVEFTLRSLDGMDVSLVEYRGSVVILDFWATWCKPCTTTFPELHALQQDYADRGVVLLVVSLDRSAQRARDHLEKNGFPIDNVLWGSLEEARGVKDLYGVGGIPRTFLIDRAGYIRYSGYPTRLTPEEIELWL
jgi:thiol-disulfide isomerase/thioredoxin